MHHGQEPESDDPVALEAEPVVDGRSTGQSAAGTLTVVATPIGHLDDITLRALKALADADLVLAEDTRRSRVLLEHHGISRPLRPFHAHSPDRHVDELLGRLEGGESLVLISDAGTPLVSDPGARLVAAARDAHIPVTSTPGPSAVLAALTIAGLRADRFRFIGFLARQGKRRRTALAEIAAAPEATVLFESPRRVAALLKDLAPLLDQRRLAVCRELTKLHEEIRRGTCAELLSHFGEGARGEVTVVIEASDSVAAPAIDEEAFIDEALVRGEHPRAIAKALASQSPLSASEAYAKVRARRTQRAAGSDSNE